MGNGDGEFVEIGRAGGPGGGASSALTRRGFLRNSTATGLGGSLLLKTQNSALGQGATAEGVLRCGIIGYGDQGKSLRESAIFLKDSVRFPAVVDIWERNRRAGPLHIRAKGQGVGEDGKTCTGYEDVETMLEEEDLQAVIIATPPFFHRRYTEMAMEAGLHVYCEKPMSNSIADARAMVRAQRRTGKLLQIGHQRRSNPRYLHARNAILHEAKLLGRMVAAEAHWNRSYPASLPREVPAGADVIPAELLERHGYSKGVQGAYEHRNWRLFRQFGTGTFGDLASHQVDVLNWFFGDTPRFVQAAGGLDFFKPESLKRDAVEDIEVAIANTRSARRAEKLQADLAQIGGITRWRDEECVDNLMAIFEYDTPRARWDDAADADERVVSRASYSFSSMTASQSFYEKFMGEYGAMGISEIGYMERLHRASHAPDWEQHEIGAQPLLVREKWVNPGKEVPAGGPQTKQGFAVLPFSGSVYWPSYRLPDHARFNERAHTPHLRNFFEVVAKGGKQEELNCPAEESFKTLVTVLKIEEAIARRATVELKAADFET